MNKEQLLANAKPILFNTEMVRAILDGRKTVTRRMIKLDLGLADTDKGDSSYLSIPDAYGDYHDVKDLCRYKVGDILYVRETWKKYEKMIGTGRECHLESFIGYKANENIKVPSEFFESKWHPSIHMPKEAARIFLKVTGVRVERLNDITSKEAIKEGLKDKYAYGEYNSMEPKKLFIDLWNSTINKHDLDSYGWEANPFVWVIEFEKIELLKE